jgi:1,2-diacylglycerol 3-alpha-glucosyltransferase
MMNRKNVLLASDSYLPVMDGVTNVVKNYLMWLNRNYYNAYLATPSAPSYNDNEEYNVLRYMSVPFKMRDPYKFGLNMIDLKFWYQLNKIPFELIHVHSPFSSANIGLTISKRDKVPLIATFHSKYYDDFKQFFKLDFIAQLCTDMIVNFYNKVDQVWTVNESTADTMRSYGYKGNIEIVPNGIDTKSSKLVSLKAQKIKERYNLNSKEPVFLYIGQHTWQKNLKMLIESLHYLKDINFKMFFAGEGYAKEKIIEYAQELGIIDKLIFLGKVTDRDYITALYEVSDLFLFPSLYDTASIVVREAASMKVPSVLIKDANAAEGIYDNENGFLTANKPFEYSCKIREILNNKEQLKSVAYNAKMTLVKNWEEIIDDVYGRYNELIMHKQKSSVYILSR